MARLAAASLGRRAMSAGSLPDRAGAWGWRTEGGVSCMSGRTRVHILEIVDGEYRKTLVADSLIDCSGSHKFADMDAACHVYRFASGRGRKCNFCYLGHQPWRGAAGEPD